MNEIWNQGFTSTCGKKIEREEQDYKENMMKYKPPSRF